MPRAKELIAAAQDWLNQEYGLDWEHIDRMSDEAVRKEMDRQYPEGWSGFAQDLYSDAE